MISKPYHINEKSLETNFKKLSDKYIKNLGYKLTTINPRQLEKDAISSFLGLDSKLLPLALSNILMALKIRNKHDFQASFVEIVGVI